MQIPNKFINGDFYDKEYFENGPYDINYGTQLDRFPQELIEIVSAVFDINDKTILDVGCAKGQYVRAMLKHSDNVRGFDFSDYCMNHLETDEYRIKKMTALEIWNYPDKEFEFIYCADLLEHIPTNTIKFVLDELNRVCKMGAEAYINIGLGDMEEHLNNHSMDKWREFFKKSGWDVDIDKTELLKEEKKKHELFKGCVWCMLAIKKRRNI